VIGLPYAALPKAVRSVEVGLRVIGLDSDGDRVDDVEAGRSNIRDALRTAEEVLK
jgi:UDP-N-acetyl-D-mannosaminuronate dehydrogenase